MSNERKHFEYYNHDERSNFANGIFKLIYQKYKGDFSNILMLHEASVMVKHLDEYVRNIYEVIDDEIPMMAYIQVYRHGSTGFCEWEDYQKDDALKLIESYCHKHYA